MRFAYSLIVLSYYRAIVRFTKKAAYYRSTPLFALIT